MGLFRNRFRRIIIIIVRKYYYNSGGGDGYNRRFSLYRRREIIRFSPIQEESERGERERVTLRINRVKNNNI